MPLLLNFSSLPNIFASLIVVAAIVMLYFLWKIKKQLNDSELVHSEFGCYEDAYKLIPSGIIVLNPDKNFIYVNPAAETMLNCRLRSVMGRPYKDVFKLQHLKTKRSLQGVLSDDSSANKDTVACECLLKPVNNQAFPISLDIIPLIIQNNTDSFSYSLMVFKNITVRKDIELKLSNIEKFDSLTRMLNRRSFEAEVKHLIESSYKQNATHVLAYFSIDQFHAINDTVGYTGGDSLIIKIGDIIISHLRKGLDVIGRVSEDEFAVIFREGKLALVIKEIEAIISDAEKFEFTSMGNSYSVTMSAGFIMVDSESTSSTRVISEAKSACNLARKSGGNQLFAYKAVNSEIDELEGNFEWVKIIKDAIKNNLFQLHAQPIHPLKPDDYAKPFCHYELLIRLADDEGNQIPTVEFLSAAEYYSMMPRIDRWVVRNALQKISKLPEQNPLPFFAINLSGQSLNDVSFLEYVLEEVKTSGVDPQMLCFEITEQVAVEDLSLVNGFISSLKSLGSKFSLDDFGTGVSSYGYLRSLDVDYLKIDGSFVKNIVDDDVAKAMVQSINYVGHTMNLKVIAEYVENEKILALLRIMGVDYGQGYQVLRPIPLDEVLKQHLVDEEDGSFIDSKIL